MKYIISFLTIFFSNLVNAKYEELDLKSVEKYHVCDANWIAEISNIGCNEKLVRNLVSHDDDRIINKYIPYSPKREKILATTTNKDPENVLEVLQEVPLEFTVSTFENNFYGVFYGQNEKKISQYWFVKCDSTRRECIVSSELASITINQKSTTMNINPKISIDTTSITKIDEAINFASWAITKMK